MGLVSVSIQFTYYTICTLNISIPLFYSRTHESFLLTRTHKATRTRTEQHGNHTTKQPTQLYTLFKHSYNVVKINQKLIKKFYKNVLTLYYDFDSMVSDKQSSK